MRRWCLGGVALALSMIVGSAAALADEDLPACGMLPPKFVEENHSAQYGMCVLHKVREQALWKGLRSDRLVRQSRFTFVDGHLRWVWTIRIDERANGKGRVEVTRIGRPANLPRNRPHTASEINRHWHRDVSREKMAQFNALADAADIWKFENGNWDNDEKIYIHCTTLAMERVTLEGFRFSNVNISCNRPRKLVPPIEHVLEMAELDWDDVRN